MSHYLNGLGCGNRTVKNYCISPEVTLPPELIVTLEALAEALGNIGDLKQCLACQDKKHNFGTHFLQGPISFSNMREVFSWIQSSSLSGFVLPTGEIIDASKWLACGEININQASDGGSCILLNGADKPVSGFEDSDGIYPHTTIELPDGCCAWVSACIPYNARPSVCADICIDGEPLCIDGEPVELVVFEPC